MLILRSVFVYSGGGARLEPYGRSRPYDDRVVSPPGRRRRSSIDPSVVIPKELSSDKMSAILAKVKSGVYMCGCEEAVIDLLELIKLT